MRTFTFRFARDERMPRAIRGKADFWLARGAAAKLGVADRDDDDDDLRISAVFALSQQPKDVAVLYRSNLQAQPIESALKERQIPFRMIGGQQFFERKEVKDLVAYLRVVLKPPRLWINLPMLD